MLLSPAEVERDVVGFPPGSLPYQAHFVGSEKCGTCHTEHYRQQRDHPMALTGRVVTPENAGLWFSDERLGKAVAWRAADVPRYRTTAEGVVLESTGRSVRVGAVFGSGARGFTPIGAGDGRTLRELRLSFSSAHDSWLMTPGSERDRDPLGEPDSVEQSGECLGCHSTTLAWKNDVLDFGESELGIQCERCHGPGSAHLESVQSGNPTAIFNPGALRADGQVEFCGQCHRQPFDIDPLNVMSRDPSMARHAGAGLMLSECFRRSPKDSTITCLDCHDPHTRVASADRVRASCLRCHASPEKDHRSIAIGTTSDCVPCHMPVETGGLYGLGFTDHWIRRPDSPLPIDSFEREEYLEYLEKSYRVATQADLGPERKAKLGVALAEVSFARGNYETSVRTLEEALSFSPSYPQRLRAASLFRQLGRIPEAVEVLEQAIASEPASTEALCQQGELLHQQGRMDQAASRYRKALELDPDSAAAHNGLGSVLGSQGKLEEALPHFRSALGVSPHFPEAHQNLGLALQKLGKLDEARREFEAALLARPDWPAAQNALARILATHPEAERREPAEAVRLADRAAELTEYENPVILDTLAAAYASAGQFEKAVAAAEEAIRLSSDPAQAEPIRARLRLYREKKAYVEASRN